MSVPITDRPGMLHQLTGIIKNVGANILEVVHDRHFQNAGITGTNVYFTLETKGEDHLKLLLVEMKKDFPLAKIVQ